MTKTDEEKRTEIINFCKNLYLGNWWIETSYEPESFGYQTIRGYVKDQEHHFNIFISEYDVAIDGYLAYQFTEEKDTGDAWVRIDSITKEAEIIFEDDNYPDKLREDLSNLVPKISEMLNVLSEFIKNIYPAITLSYEARIKAEIEAEIEQRERERELYEDLEEREIQELHEDLED
jgi:hypothetical protein